MKKLLTFSAASLLACTAFAAQRTYLGTETSKTDKALQAQLALDKNIGHTVHSIASDSPAAKAGLQKGDIITAINGRKVKNFIKLNNIIASMYNKGEKITLFYLRNGKALETAITLASHEVDEKQATIQPQAAQEADSTIDLLAQDQVEIKEMMKKLRKFGGTSQVIEFDSNGSQAGFSMSSAVNDGQHKIAISSVAKDKKKVKVTNLQSKKIEFEGVITGNDYSNVPEPLRKKVRQAAEMGHAIKVIEGKKSMPSQSNNIPKEVLDMMAQIQSGKGINTPNAMPEEVKQMIAQVQGQNGGNNAMGMQIKTAVIDGQHNISISSQAKGAKSIKVVNMQNKAIEFDGVIHNNDFSSVPAHIRNKVQRAAGMINSISIINGSKGIKPQEADVDTQVDDLLKKLERKRAKKTEEKK